MRVACRHRPQRSTTDSHGCLWAHGSLASSLSMQTLIKATGHMPSPEHLTLGQQLLGSQPLAALPPTVPWSSHNNSSTTLLRCQLAPIPEQTCSATSHSVWPQGDRQRTVHEQPAHHIQGFATSPPGMRPWAASCSAHLHTQPAIPRRRNFSYC